VHFLTGTLRNVFYVRVGKRYARLWRSQRSRTVVWRLVVRRKLEDACCHQSHAHCHRWCHGHTPGVQTEPQVEPATSAGIILPETGQFLLLCSLQMWQQLQLQCCRQSRASVQVFSCILLPFNGNSLLGTTRFLVKQTVTSERSRSETRG